MNVTGLRYKTFYYRRKEYGTKKPRFKVAWKLAGITQTEIDAIKTIAKCYVKKGTEWLAMPFDSITGTGRASIEVFFTIRMYPRQSTGLPDATHVPELRGMTTSIKLVLTTATQVKEYIAMLTIPSSKTGYIHTGFLESSPSTTIPVSTIVTNQPALPTGIGGISAEMIGTIGTGQPISVEVGATTIEAKAKEQQNLLLIGSAIFFIAVLGFVLWKKYKK